MQLIIIFSGIHSDQHLISPTSINNNIITKENLSALNNNNNNGGVHHHHNVLVMNNNQHHIHEEMGQHHHTIMNGEDMGEDLDNPRRDHHLIHNSANSSPNDIGHERLTVVSLSS